MWNQIVLKALKTGILGRDESLAGSLLFPGRQVSDIGALCPNHPLAMSEDQYMKRQLALKLRQASILKPTATTGPMT